MSQGSKNASEALNASLVNLCLVMFSSTGAEAAGATYVVGAAGRSIRKAFLAGDYLVLNYSSNDHNVVAVDKVGYSKCSAPPRPRVFKFGRDKVKLIKGHNYFICSIVGHCESGMKIDINAV